MPSPFSWRPHNTYTTPSTILRQSGDGPRPYDLDVKRAVEDRFLVPRCGQEVRMSLHINEDDGVTSSVEYIDIEQMGEMA